MNLKDIAKAPQLIKITIDDADIVAVYGEPLEFYTWDRAPLDTFLTIANGKSADMGVIFEAIKLLVLDFEGNQVITDGVTLPGSVLMKVMNKIVETLGK